MESSKSMDIFCNFTITSSLNAFYSKDNYGKNNNNQLNYMCQCDISKFRKQTEDKTETAQ